MNVIISARHLTLKDGDKTYATEKFTHVSRIHSVDTIDVVIGEQNQKISCEAKLTVPHAEPLVLTVEADQVREAIDLAVDKSERQLRRLKEKRQDKHFK